VKIMTILGTRPEIIRLSRLIPLLDRLCEHVVLHTGQNYDRTLNDVFFDDLGLRRPDRALDCRADSDMGQIARVLIETEAALGADRPDRVLVLGDTNSALSVLAAKRARIPVFHVEAGNRCYDDRVPEEVNRRLIDHASDVLLPYTERSRANLLREGIDAERIFVVGNPIKEVLDFHAARIAASKVLTDLGLEPGQFFLATLHRAENVDAPARLARFFEAFRRLHERHRIPVVLSLHPRTRARLAGHAGILATPGLVVHEPFGLFDFVRLEQTARCVLTDSGTVQEECCIFGIPSVTIRDCTERPETLEAGSGILSGADPATIVACVSTVLGSARGWTPPPEYTRGEVSTTVAKIVLAGVPCGR
jgi:UDP-N-acetylglucosamine 2-epimerase (non-hydrolysing)